MNNKKKDNSIDTKKLVEENMGIVYEVMKTISFKKMGAFMDYDDLKQMGLVHLCKAAEKYRPDMGYKFSTYAYTVVRNGYFSDLKAMRKHGIDYTMTRVYDEENDESQEAGNKKEEGVCEAEFDASILRADIGAELELLKHKDKMNRDGVYILGKVLEGQEIKDIAKDINKTKSWCYLCLGTVRKALQSAI